MLTIFILLISWGFFAVALGVVVLACAFLVDQAWGQIELGREHKDD